MLIVVELVTPPELAPIVVVPIPLAVANPAMLGAFAMVATLEEAELQCVVSVTSCTVPSLKVPVAVNLMDVPLAIVGLAGVIAIDTRCTFATVRLVDPLTAPRVAVIVADPMATLLARP